MKKYGIYALILTCIFVVGCETSPSETEVIGGEAECVKDDDCVKGGCSGTICQGKDSKPIFTTCEYLPEYDCYKSIQCGCIKGKCQWDKTAEFDRCVEEKREVGG